MMTINQIRKEAPEGATHYDDNDFFMLNGNDLWRWIGKWLYLSNCSDAKEYCKDHLKPLY